MLLFVVGSRELTFFGDDGAVIVDESKIRSTPTPWLTLILVLGKIRVNQTTSYYNIKRNSC